MVDLELEAAAKGEPQFICGVRAAVPAARAFQHFNVTML
jgi:hypothetical protein